MTSGSRSRGNVTPLRVEQFVYFVLRMREREGEGVNDSLLNRAAATDLTPSQHHSSEFCHLYVYRTVGLLKMIFL